jgi:hypothetical protein
VWCKGEINIADHLTPSDLLRSVRAILVGASQGALVEAPSSNFQNSVEPVREARGCVLIKD